MRRAPRRLCHVGAQAVDRTVHQRTRQRTRRLRVVVQCGRGRTRRSTPSRRRRTVRRWVESGADRFPVRLQGAAHGHPRAAASHQALTATSPRSCARSSRSVNASVRCSCSCRRRSDRSRRIVAHVRHRSADVASMGGRTPTPGVLRRRTGPPSGRRTRSPPPAFGRVVLDTRPLHATDEIDSGGGWERRNKPRLPIVTTVMGDEPVVRVIGGDEPGAPSPVSPRGPIRWSSGWRTATSLRVRPSAREPATRPSWPARFHAAVSERVRCLVPLPEPPRDRHAFQQRSSRRCSDAARSSPSRRPADSAGW